jgi:signal transduction histidine kinase/DNA-binding LytR/AlgR family response regulator
MKQNFIFRQKFELIFIIIVLLTIIGINFIADSKMVFFNFYYLPVIMAGTFAGSRQAVMGAFLCILFVVGYSLYHPHGVFMKESLQNLYLYITAWGGFLVLAGAVVGRQHENLLKHQAELNRANESLEDKVRARTTALELLNEELKEAKIIAEKANAVKSEFLANMSHEIRTPMNAVIGMSELALSTALTDQQKEYLSIVKTSSHSLLNLINDILDFSKIEAGMMAFEAIPFDLRETVENVSGMFIVKSREKKLKFTVEIAQDVPLNLVADQLRIRQVLVNLVSNAFKFTEKGEIVLSITLKARREESAEIVFCVRDSGLGIDENALTSLFTPFSQEDSSVTRKFGGTGLGLSICKKIVTMMGGDIWVESKKGEGSSFYFTVKVAIDKQKKPFRAFPHGKSGKNVFAPGSFAGLKILLVEDNDVNLMIAREMLVLSGIEVDTAGNGVEAIQKIQGKKYDAVLMDIQMPVMDGVEAVKRIRRIPGHSSLPVIAMTANALHGDREKCLLAGMNDYLSKPINSRKLFNALKVNIKKPDDSGEKSGIQRVAKKNDVPGINIQEGLNRLGIPYSSYLKMLQKYGEVFRNFPMEMAELIENGNFKEANFKVHALKGAAANIAAEPLCTIASDLEVSCASKDSEKAAMDLASVGRALDEVIASVDLLMKESRK